MSTQDPKPALNPYHAPATVSYNGRGNAISSRVIWKSVAISVPLWVMIFIVLARPTSVHHFAGFIPCVVGGSIGVRAGARSRWGVVGSAMAGSAIALVTVVFIVVAFQDLSVAISSVTTPVKWLPFIGIAIGFGFAFGLTVLLFASFFAGKSRPA